MEALKIVKKLGSGSMGEVNLVKSNNQYFAIKKIAKTLTTRPQIKESFVKELSMLNELKHKNIITLYKVSEDANFHYLTLEYCNGNSLHHCLKHYMKKYKKPFSEEIVQYLMKQIVDGLQFIHQHDIIHRDMKLANILVKFYAKEDIKNINMMKSHLKISDFGISIKAKQAFTLIGTAAYLDPIILKKMNERNDLKDSDGYDKSADIWSLGALCYEMLTGNRVFNGRNQNELFNKVEIGDYSIPSNLSKEVVSFLTGMLQYNPKKRLNIDQISKHEFLNKNVKNFSKIDLGLFGNKVGPNGLNINIKKNQTVMNILKDYDKLSAINRILNLNDSIEEVNKVPALTKDSQFNKFIPKLGNNGTNNSNNVNNMNNKNININNQMQIKTNKNSIDINKNKSQNSTNISSLSSTNNTNNTNNTDNSLKKYNPQQNNMNINANQNVYQQYKNIYGYNMNPQINISSNVSLNNNNIPQNTRQPYNMPMNYYY